MRLRCCLSVPVGRGKDCVSPSARSKRAEFPECVCSWPGGETSSRFRRRKVQFLGEVKDLPALYAAADIFLLPTIYDPFSNACLEALAAGVPVITTRANGFSEIIMDGQHGTVVEDPRDFVALRAGLHYWAEPRRREEARPAIQQHAAQFDISINVARTLEVLDQAASAASPKVSS